MTVKKQVVEKAASKPITDILEVYFREDGIQKVKKSFMSGDELIEEKIETA